MSNPLILIVEDEADSANILEAYLKRDFFDVAIAEDGLKGVELHQRLKPDLILLDMMLPRMNGSEVLNVVRKRGNTPVIMVTALGDEPEKLGALRYGADDYVVKPYNPKEVVARVQAVLRRTRANSTGEARLRFGALWLDPCSRTVGVSQDEGMSALIDLTPTEFNLLSVLFNAPQKAFSREELLERCLPESDALARVVDTHIHNVRRKLEVHGVSDLLVTVRSIGYRFQ
ncbi:Transcriptional regulatory protein SrrA [compost metagenome]|uniref:response regulator n=1 Tax=Pseudomonas TaxID=286 RepID=UPI0004084695|nr:MULTISPECIES: response regulator [Pseudomonas]MCW2271322.1 DNA-binding response OmpR family regulator [Pseudomonas sp. JUb96]PRA71394.1 DNA-binding response regulator [Pseudomonas sp. MYb187]